MPKPILKHRVTLDAQRFNCNEFNEVKTWLSAFPTPLEFLHFFSIKLKTLHKDNQKALELMEGYRESSKKLMDLEEQLQVRDQLSFRLQKCLSEAEICIHDERENYLKLIAENEQLKLENEDFRRKFHTALLLSGTSEKDVMHFLQRHPKANEITDEMIKVKEEIRICSGEKTNNFEMLDPAILTKQVNVLEKQLKETKTVHQEKLQSLKKSIKLSKEEYGVRIYRLEDRLTHIVHQLEDKTSLLHRSLIENLKLQKQIILNEDEWVEERKQLMCNLKSGSHSISEKPNPPLVGPDTRKEEIKDQSHVLKQLQRSISRYEIQLMDKENLVTEYKMQTLRLEKQMHRLREENEEYKKVSNDQARKLLDRNLLLLKRLEENELRRKLDGDGFRADVKSIKNILNIIDRQLHNIIRRGICDTGTVDAPSMSQISLPPARRSNKPVLKLSPKRLQSAPTLGAAVIEGSRRRRRRSRSSLIKATRNRSIQFLDTPTTIKSLKEYKDSSRITRAAFTKLLEVAQEKLKFLDQLVAKTGTPYK